MLFATFDFLLFFAVAFAGYWALRDRPGWRLPWLVGASYFFYTAAPKPVDGPLPTPWYFVGLLLLSTVVDYACGLAIAAARERSGVAGAEQAERAHAGSANANAGAGPGKVWLIVSLVANLGLLGYFKYTGFLLQVAADVRGWLGMPWTAPVFDVLLPVGISFYTFQSLSYTIDVYRGRIAAERSFVRYATFVAFFPALMAGPILRASEFLPQLRARPSLTREDVDFALWRIAKGLVKKMLFADFVAASFTDRVFAAPAEHSSLENLLALYAFTLQIYADFSGYSDIAIGTARLLGFRLPENFDRPYQAASIAEFWRRWHMTLSTWLRDYVYYPLGGSRLGPTRTLVNLWVTMFLVGIWHGASWNFVIYALLQATAMIYNRVCAPRKRGSAQEHGSAPRGAWGARLGRVAVVSAIVGLGATWLGAAGLALPDPWTFGALSGALAFGIALLPEPERWPALLPLHVALTVHFSVLSRVFFRADDLQTARAMAGKLLTWDGLGVRDGMFGNELLARWLEGVPALAWARPLADSCVLVVLVAGFAAHYVPARWGERFSARVLPRVPALLAGVGFAVLLGFLSLLLAGPRANIYFAF